MKISQDLKNSLLIGNSNVINEQVYKKLLECCFAKLTKQPEVTSISQLYNSKPDVIKEVHAAFLSVIGEFARHNYTKEGVAQFLTSECNYATNRADIFSELYDSHQIKLQIVLGNIGSHLPHIVDVKWKIDYIVKSSDMDQAEGPIFRVTLITEKYDGEENCNKLEKINFSCDSRELQDLVYKLKEATRHCQKIASVS